MNVIGTCVSMTLKYGVPLITLVDKFRHARFEPSGMTSNKNIPFAKSLIDYIFCWMGCRFIPGYAELNTPNRNQPPSGENKTSTTAKQLVEKTQDLAKKIGEAKAVKGRRPITELTGEDKRPTLPKPSRFAKATLDRLVAVVGTAMSGEGTVQPEAAVIKQLNDQFQHFQDDAPACDVCGAIRVRNQTCPRSSYC